MADMSDLLEVTYVPNKQQWVRDQVAAFEASDGQEANVLAQTGDPIVVITGRGAKNEDRLYKNPVMRVTRDGKYLAVASKGGAPEHPVWYHNFLAHPVVQLQDGPEPALYRARLIEDQREYDEWRQRAVEVYEPYAEYKPRAEEAGRTIPLFVLERI